MCSFPLIALRSPLIEENSHVDRFVHGEVEALKERIGPACTDRLWLLRRDPEGRTLQLDR